MANGLPKKLRIAGRGEISELFEKGRRGSSGPVAARTLPNGLGFSRLAAVSGKKLGNAVKRNRMRRLLRAAFRTQKDVLPAGVDVALIARPGLLEASWQEILEAVRRAIWKAEGGRDPGPQA